MSSWIQKLSLDANQPKANSSPQSSKKIIERQHETGMTYKMIHDLCRIWKSFKKAHHHFFSHKKKGFQKGIVQHFWSAYFWSTFHERGELLLSRRLFGVGYPFPILGCFPHLVFRQYFSQLFQKLGDIWNFVLPIETAYVEIIDHVDPLIKKVKSDSVSRAYHTLNGKMWPKTKIYLFLNAKNSYKYNLNYKKNQTI